MNIVTLIGRACKDPELNFVAGSGVAVCKFTIAVDRIAKEGKKEADFINCVAFGKRAEVISQYVQKGHMIGINGSIRTGSYEAKDGTKRYTTEIYIDEFQFLEKGNKPASVENFDFGVEVTDGDIPW